MSVERNITVAYGDGIGPEIMEATLSILTAAGARIHPEVIEVGEAAYKKGHTAGISNDSWESLRRTKVFLKAPVTTPQGKGFKSLNVTVRKTLGLYANVRPCVSYAPFVKTNHPALDVVIVRENEEDLYAGIEHRQTADVVQCLKLISRPGCERIARYAFEYARAHGRKKITCLSKDNIMKLTDGLFRSVFEEVGAEYPDVAHDHMIIDIGTARLANRPQDFDVVLAPNLYGDIVSDVVAEISGSVGLGASSNVGDFGAMFEAVHGSAPDIAGKDMANPSGLLLSAVEMLVHIGQADVAAKVHDAWARTLEDGIHTGDLFQEGLSTQRVGTKGFTAAIVARLGQKPQKIRSFEAKAAASKGGGQSSAAIAPQPLKARKAPEKSLVGVDVFVDVAGGKADDIAARIQAVQKSSGLELHMITNRGTRVWPDGHAETFTVDHWRCRFKPVGSTGSTLVSTKFDAVVVLLAGLNGAGLEPIKTENLYAFDGERGYSLGQGEG
jgi:isocitrate dehydrogenase